MSISPPSLTGSPSLQPQSRLILSPAEKLVIASPASSSSSSSPGKIIKDYSPSSKSNRKLPFWIPMKVAPLSSYREREEMIQAIINRQTSNTYDKFYDTLGFADFWSKSDFQNTAIKTIRNLIFEGQELAKCNKKSKEDSEKKDKKIKALEAEIEAKVTENDSIQKDHSIMEEQLNSASGQIATLEQTIDDLQEELIDAKQEADEAKQECETLKNRINAEAILLFENWTKLMDRRSLKTSSVSSTPSI